MDSLTDTSLMPFGKHKNKQMKDVPADYLLWLWNSGLNGQTNTMPVARYIRDSMDALKMDAPDVIVDP